MLKFYVYAYLDINGLPYYIGKGTARRMYEQSHRVQLPTRSRIVILESNLSEVGAFAIERRLIRWYGKKCNGSGILENIAAGGQGTSQKGQANGMYGKTHTPEVKARLKQLNSGKIISREVCDKISLTLKMNMSQLLPEERKEKFGRPGETNGMYGKHHSEETRRVLRRKNSKKPIFCHQTNVIYVSQQEAARTLQLRQGDIANVLGKRQKSTKGFTFEWAMPTQM